MAERSKVIKSKAFRWDGIPLRDYGADATYAAGVTRQVLLGDGAGEEPLAFVTRYFEVQPGGFTALEHHRHPHAVVVVQGSGEVELDGDVHALGPFDAVYVAPGTLHQFRASGTTPLGFLCVVDRERDEPVRVKREGGAEA